MLFEGRETWATGLRRLPDGSVEENQLGKSPGGRWEILVVCWRRGDPENRMIIGKLEAPQKGGLEDLLSAWHRQKLLWVSAARWPGR